jgi:large subunit ribosomal protein L23Ae
MATKAKKPAPKKAASVQSKTGAGAALAERSKDAAKKPTFGKAAPRKVAPAAKTATPAAKPVSGSTKKSGEPSLATKIAHVAAGAVVATAKGAASVAASFAGKGKAKSK